MREIIALIILLVGLSLIGAQFFRKKEEKMSVLMVATVGIVFAMAAFGVVNYDSIQRLNLQAKTTKLELERFNQNVDSITNQAVQELQNQIETQKQDLLQIKDQAERTKNEIEIVHGNTSNLALLLTKIAWLQIVTKNEFGSNRDISARENILKELNQILLQIIPDEKQRSQWIDEMYKLLPKQ